MSDEYKKQVKTQTESYTSPLGYRNRQSRSLGEGGLGLQGGDGGGRGF